MTRINQEAMRLKIMRAIRCREASVNAAGRQYKPTSCPPGKGAGPISAPQLRLEGVRGATAASSTAGVLSFCQHTAQKQCEGD